MTQRNVNHMDADHGFSIVELLTVVAIIATLSVLAGLGISSIQRASALRTDGTALFDTLSMARQAAMTQNRPVRVWLCQGIPASGGEADSILIYWEETSADGELVRVPVERELKLHTAVAFAENTDWSSLLEAAAADPSIDPKYDESRPSFRFLPDGSTDLPDGSARTLTLIHRNDQGAESLPSNFFTLQIDQQTGAMQIFRPQ